MSRPVVLVQVAAARPALCRMPMVAARPFSGARHLAFNGTLVIHVDRSPSLCFGHSEHSLCAAVAFPANFKYTRDHEWVEAAETAKVGISDFAQEELGDLVYVDLPEVNSIATFIEHCQNPLGSGIHGCGKLRMSHAQVGTEFEKGEAFAAVESVKVSTVEKRHCRLGGYSSCSWCAGTIS